LAFRCSLKLIPASVHFSISKHCLLAVKSTIFDPPLFYKSILVINPQRFTNLVVGQQFLILLEKFVKKQLIFGRSSSLWPHPRPTVSLEEICRAEKVKRDKEI